MSVAHEAARAGDDRKAAAEGFEGRLASGPLQGVQQRVARQVQAEEALEVEAAREVAGQRSAGSPCASKARARRSRNRAVTAGRECEMKTNWACGTSRAIRG